MPAPRKPKKKTQARKHRHTHVRNEQEITILDTHPIRTSDDNKILSRPAREQVRWKHEHNKRFVVQFVGDTPFAEHIFYTGKQHSGKITYTGPAPKEFKYQVGVGGSAVDPKVIINP